MKLLRPRNGGPLLLRLLRSMATTRVSLSTATEVSSRAPPLHDSLYNRVVMVANPRLPIVPVLERWVEEGNAVGKGDLQSIVKKMKTMRRYSHALEISMWMSDRRYFPISPGDAAYRLELISKVHGLENAETYFNNLPQQLKVYQPYGALLRCYAEEKAVEKAEALFERMKELNMVTSYAYSALMKLYCNMGQPDKVHSIFQSMEEKGVIPDVFSYDILIEAYASAADIQGIENMFERIKNQKNLVNWHIYAVAATGFINAGLPDKALVALRESEKLIPKNKGQVAFGYLLSVCADIGNKNELYRIWNTYKLRERASNSMYMCMISLLLKKMDDIEAAETILKEWESKFSFYDFRVPNLLIGAYCAKGLLGKAEALVSEAVENGKTPFANTWDRMASGYFKDGQISKGVEMTKRALVAGQIGWKPNPRNAIESLNHFLEQQDVEAAEELVRLLKRLVPLTTDVYNYLLRIYLSAGKPLSDLLERMRNDGIEEDEETARILEGKSSTDVEFEENKS
ncbi:Pentatricopeptide repeat-containing protein, mitochondrial [Ananas comosus]|uniref:Pentatricopeptide repeat-containing protein, mitochondrial n=1 Tax=Ananas comosus TaxID=4615 RepID=A0A199V6M6_ANACO|nr:Pentatricopeptide repeat-containing protein, mitochondrial [Ananas comosus]